MRNHSFPLSASLTEPAFSDGLETGQIVAQSISHQTTARWFALTVRHQHERQTGRLLREHGWETLVPVYTAERQWSDRVKQVELPLFSGYVFCRFPLTDRMWVEDTPGVARVVEFGGAPAAVLDREIEEIRTLMTSKLPLSPWPFLAEGDRVEVRRGPLRGLEGTLIEIPEASGKREVRLVISVVMLQRSVAVEVDPGMIAPARDF